MGSCDAIVDQIINDSQLKPTRLIGGSGQLRWYSSLLRFLGGQWDFML